MPAMPGTKFNSVEEYFSSIPTDVKTILEQLRRTIKEVAPEAEEVISYNMPAFKFHSILVYYAAHKEHIGLYPGNSHLIELFKEVLSKYKTSKGAIQFPIDKYLPLRLIKKIVKYRVKENIDKEKIKSKIK